jgi:hypothetical protein
VEVVVISCLDSILAMPPVLFCSREEGCGLGIVEAAIDLAAGRLDLVHHP